MATDQDVTDAVRIGNPDDETLPMLQCVCGRRFERWNKTISVYREDADPMPCCGRRLYFRQQIRVFARVSVDDA